MEPLQALHDLSCTVKSYRYWHSLLGLTSPRINWDNTSTLLSLAYTSTPQRKTSNWGQDDFQDNLFIISFLLCGHLPDIENARNILKQFENFYSNTGFKWTISPISKIFRFFSKVRQCFIQRSKSTMYLYVFNMHLQAIQPRTAEKAPFNSQLNMISTTHYFSIS